MRNAKHMRRIGPIEKGTRTVQSVGRYLDRDVLGSMLNPEDDASKVTALKKELSRLQAIAPLFSEGAISPTQYNRMSDLQKKEYHSNVMKRWVIEDELKELSKSDEQRLSEQRQRRRIKIEGRLLQLQRHIEDLEHIYIRPRESAGKKPKPSILKELENAQAEQMALQSELQRNNPSMPKSVLNPKAVEDMTAGEINKALDKIDEADSRLTREFIEAGRGNERPSEIFGMSDPLAQKYKELYHKRMALRNEAERRYGPRVPSRLPKGFGPIRRNPAEDGQPWLKMADGRTLAQAQALAEKLKREDRKLRTLGGTGNYSAVEVRPTFERVHGKKEYGVFVIMRTENPAKFDRCVRDVHEHVLNPKKQLLEVPDKGTANDRYERIALEFAEGNVDAWRMGTDKEELAGLAWIAETEDGRDLRVIDVPQPDTVEGLYLWLHETAHHYYRHPDKELPYHLEEWEATKKALDVMREEGIGEKEIGPELMEELSWNVCQAMEKDEKKGIEIDRRVEEFCKSVGEGSERNPMITLKPVMHRGENPSQSDVHPGDYVKALFTNRKGEGERMWIKVTGVAGRRVTGRLDNVPFFKHEGGLRRGSRVTVSTDDLYDHMRKENPAKFDRCVRDVQAQGGDVNAYAVCTAAGTRNPSSLESFTSREAAEGYARLMEAEGWIAKVVRAGIRKWRVELKKITGNPSDSEERARAIGSDPKRLKARLMEAKSVLVDPGSFGKAKFDFSHKMLVSEDGKTALQWRIRRYPDRPESYENQQTNVGSVFLVNVSGRRNPEGEAAQMFETFHGMPSEHVEEYVEDEHYHENLAEIGVLCGVLVETEYAGTMALAFSGYKWNNKEGEFELKAGRENPLFGGLFGKKTTHYRVKHGMKTTTAAAHKGHQIVKGASGYQVPSIEPESVFDSVKDAKKFIDSWAKNRRNPSSEATLLATNEKGNQLFLVGGDQSVDLDSFKFKGAEKDHESIILGSVPQITYHTSKVFDGKREEYDYFHNFSEDTKGPLPILRYDAANEKLFLDGGSYKIEKPAFSTSPGIED